MSTNPTNTQVPPEIEKIRNKLVHQLDLEHLSREDQAEVIAKLSTIILDRTAIALVSQLPEEIMDHVNTLLESGQTDAVEAIFLKHIERDKIDKIVNTVIGDTIADFKRLNSENAQKQTN